MILLVFNDINIIEILIINEKKFRNWLILLRLIDNGSIS